MADFPHSSRKTLGRHHLTCNGALMCNGDDWPTRCFAMPSEVLRSRPCVGNPRPLGSLCGRLMPETPDEPRQALHSTASSTKSFAQQMDRITLRSRRSPQMCNGSAVIDRATAVRSVVKDLWEMAE